MCMIDAGDGDDWTNLSDTRQRARKEHRCHECLRTIRVGESYRRSVAVERGYRTPDVSRMCAHCDAVSSWLIQHCGGFVFRCIREDMAEHDVAPDDEYRKRAIAGIDAKWAVGSGDELMPVPGRLVAAVEGE